MLRRMVLILAVMALAVMAGAQTKAPAKETPPSKEGDAAALAFNRALLQPARLTEKAPDVYDARFNTTKGDFVVRVTRAWSPQGAGRFYNLVKNGFYDGAGLFRVVPGFVVQFGLGAHPQVNQAWLNATIQDEPVKGSNRRGFVTYAKSSAPNSRTTQVFINLGDNARLDGMGFAPFGEVVEGMDVVEKLYGGYAEEPTSKQREITLGGKAYLEKAFPKLDSIKTATIVPVAAPPAKK